MGGILNVSYKIQLTKGLEAIVDDNDIELVNKYKWHSKFSKGNYYASTRVGNEIVFLHNLLIGKKEGMEVDHINQNGLDNTRGNLRHATKSQNRANVALRADNRSGYKGVSQLRNTSKWRAYIQCNKKWKELGRFNTPQEAALAYNNAATEMFGEFAWLNKI